MGQLGEEQRDDMAPVADAAGFFIRARFPRELRHEMPGNEVANLFKNRELRTGWGFFCFHTRRVAVSEESIQPFYLYAVGWLWNLFITKLRELKGISLKLILYKGRDDERRRDSDWQLDFSHARPKQLTIYLNLNAKNVDFYKLKFPVWKAEG
jgi:hypothetical protein